MSNQCHGDTVTCTAPSPRTCTCWPADYAFGERKFGGNAQAITKQRWLHHTSLLWDFRDAHMRLLKHPSKAPEYRAVRDAFPNTSLSTLAPVRFEVFRAHPRACFA